MIDASARPARSLKQAISRRVPKRRDDSGLTTLEWLLIVAAVAGLAALAVVLVTNVVSETSEQISGSSARKVAAQIAAQEITDKARAQDTDADNTYTDLNREYKSDCKLLQITYGDVDDLKVLWLADISTGPTVTVDTNVATQTAWDDASPTFGCYVG